MLESYRQQAVEGGDGSLIVICKFKSYVIKVKFQSPEISQYLEIPAWWPHCRGLRRELLVMFQRSSLLAAVRPSKQTDQLFSFLCDSEKWIFDVFNIWKNYVSRFFWKWKHCVIAEIRIRLEIVNQTAFPLSRSPSSRSQILSGKRLALFSCETTNQPQSL